MRRQVELFSPVQVTSSVWMDVLVIPSVPPGRYRIVTEVFPTWPHEVLRTVIGNIRVAPQAIVTVREPSTAAVQLRSPSGSQVTVTHCTLTVEEAGLTLSPTDHTPPERKEPLLYLEQGSGAFKVVGPDGEARDATEEDIAEGTAPFRRFCAHNQTMVAGSAKAEVRLRCSKCGFPIKTLYEHLTDDD